MHDYVSIPDFDHFCLFAGNDYPEVRPALLREWLKDKNLASAIERVDGLIKATHQAELDIQKVIDLDFWNTRYLADGELGFRRPRISLHYEVTSKGNLRLNWLPAAGDEIAWRHPEKFESPPSRLDQIILVHGFCESTRRGVAYSTREAEEYDLSTLNGKVDSYVTKLTLSLFENVIHDIKNACEVTVFDKVETTGSGHGKISGWHWLRDGKRYESRKGDIRYNLIY